MDSVYCRVDALVTRSWYMDSARQSRIRGWRGSCGSSIRLSAGFAENFYCMDIVFGAAKPVHPPAPVPLAWASSVMPRSPCRMQATRLLEQYTLFVVCMLVVTRLTVDSPPDLMISDIIRRPPSLWLICA